MLVGLACAVVAALLLQRGLGEMADVMLGNHEFDLPGWLEAVLVNRHAVWVLPLLVLVAWRALPQGHWRGTTACALGVGTLVLVLAARLPLIRFAVTL